MVGWGDEPPPLVSPYGAPFIPPPSGAGYDGDTGGMYSAFPGFQSGASPWGAMRELPPNLGAGPYPLPYGHPALDYSSTPALGFPASPTTPSWALPGAGGDPIGQSYFSSPEFQGPSSASPWATPGTPLWTAGSPLTRSLSYGGYPPSPYKHKRKKSFGGSHWHNKWGHNDDTYHAKNLARRPRDWRADYTPRGGLLSAVMGTIGRDRSDVKEYRDPVKRNIHHLLVYSKTRQRLFVHLPDLASIAFPEQGRGANELDLMQLACTPPAQGVRLMHEALPWYIDVGATHPNGITIGDVLHQLCEALMQPISARHYWTESLSDADRTNIADAYSVRCKGDVDQVKTGVRRVDFLGAECILKGFTRKSGGMWEMVTEPLKMN